MFNLAAVQSVGPLRKCKLSAIFNGFINDALLQLSPDTCKALLQIIVVIRCLAFDINTVQDLVLSLENAPQTHRTTRQIEKNWSES